MWQTEIFGPSSGSGKSWTRTSSVVPFGRHSLPPLRKGPTSSFFFVSTEMTGWPSESQGDFQCMIHSRQQFPLGPISANRQSFLCGEIKARRKPFGVSGEKAPIWGQNLVQMHTVAIVRNQQRSLFATPFEGYSYFTRRQVVRVLSNFLNSMELVDVELLGTDLSAVNHVFQYSRCLCRAGSAKELQDGFS